MSDLGPAIVGLVGVFVGAIITTGTNLLLAVRKENAEAAKERETRANQLKTAARLIKSEFSLVLATLESLVRNQDLSPKDLRFSTDAWDKHRESLALGLSNKDWDAVTLAALTAAHLVQLFRSTDRPTDDPTTDRMAHFAAVLKAGNEALAPYAVPKIEKTALEGA